MNERIYDLRMTIDARRGETPGAVQSLNRVESLHRGLRTVLHRFNVFTNPRFTEP